MRIKRMLEQRAMSEEEYLASKGVRSTAPHFASFASPAGHLSGRSKTVGRKRHAQLLDEWQRRANKLRAEYRELVKAGKLRPKGRIEKLMDAARGHPDNANVQAARRLLTKRGLWDATMSQKADSRFEGKVMKLSPRFREAVESEVRRLMEEMSATQKMSARARILAKYAKPAQAKLNRMMLDQATKERDKYGVRMLQDLVMVYQKEMARDDLKAAGLL